MKTLRLTTTTITLLLFSNLISAQVKWVGNAGDKLWSSPTNWSTNSVPTSTDDVLIDGNVTNNSIEVNINSVAACASLTIVPRRWYSHNVQVNLNGDTASLLVNGDLVMDDQYEENSYNRLNINNGAQLLVKGNFSMKKDNGNRNYNHMTLKLLGGNSTLKVDGTFYLTATATLSNNEVGIVLTKNSTLEAGNLIAKLNGDAQSMDLITLNKVGANGDSATLKVANDFTLTHEGGKMDFELLADYGALIEVGNNLTVTANNTNQGRNTVINLERDARLVVGNNTTINHKGESTSVLQLRLNQYNAGLVHDAQVTVGGDFNISSTSATLEMLVKRKAQIQVKGQFEFKNNSSSKGFKLEATEDALIAIDKDFIIHNNGPEVLEMYLDHNVSMQVGGKGEIINTNYNHIKIHLNKRANGDSTDAQLSFGGDLYIEGNQIDEVQLNMAYDADLTVGGNFTIKTNSIHDDWDYVQIELNNEASIAVVGSTTIHMAQDVMGNKAEFRMYVRNNASFTTGGNFDFKNQGRNNRFELRDKGQLFIDGNWSNFCDNTEHFEINANSDTKITVNGGFNYEKNTASNGEFKMLLNDRAQMLVQNEFTAYTMCTDNNNSEGIKLELNHDVVLNIGDSLTLDAANDGSIIVWLNQWGNGSNKDVQFTVGGNTNIRRNGPNGDRIEIRLHEDADFTIAGDLTVVADNSGDDDDYMKLYLEHFSKMTVNGDVKLDLEQIVHGHDIEFELDVRHDAQFIATGGLTMNNNGGRTNYYFRDRAVFNLGGAWLNDAQFAKEFIIEQSQDADVDVNGEFKVRHVDSEDRFRWYVRERSTVDILGPVTIVDSTTGEFEIQFDHDAIINVDGDFYASFYDINDGNPMRFRVNDGGNGNKDVQLNINGDLYLGSDYGNELICKIREESRVNIAGDFTIDFKNKNTNWWDRFEMVLEQKTIVTVDGSFTLNYDWGRNDDNTNIQLNVRGDAIFNVGTSGIAGSALTLNQFSGSGEFVINVQNNSILNVHGDLNLNKQAGKKMDFNISDKAQVNIDNDFLLGNIQNTELIKVLVRTDALLNVDNNIDFTQVKSAGKARIELDNNAVLEMGGSFLRNNLPNRFGTLESKSNSTVEYNGDQAQFFAADSGSNGDYFNYNWIVVNNTYGTIPQITLEGAVSVDKKITFIDGIIRTSTNALITIEKDGTTAGASNNSHVDGPIRKIGSTKFEFPVGNEGVWAPLVISNLSQLDTFECTYTFGEYAIAAVDTPLAYRSTEEYWELEPMGEATADVTLCWKDAARSGINTINEDLVVVHFNGIIWENYGQGTLVASTDTGGITVSNVEHFSPFTFGSLSENRNINPLPVELLNFDAELVDGAVELNWATASEINNNYFTVEVSTDGENFAELVQVNGAGNSATTVEYETTDYNPAQGWNYYRLKQTDLDGAVEYAEVRMIFVDENMIEQVVNVYPNPATINDEVYVTLNAEADFVTVELATINGLVIENIELAYVAANEEVILPTQQLTPGMYLVRVTANGTTTTNKLIIK